MNSEHRHQTVGDQVPGQLKGFRMTRDRRIILQVLRESGIPLTAEDVLERVNAAVPGIALSTVYRTLDELVSRGSMQRTLLSNDGHAFFELVGHAHRHYMVCLGCHQMFPIRKCPVEDSIDSAAEDLGFEVTDHSLVLYGYCRHCRSGRQSPGSE
ncbi:Fur family transcriptional regulator [Candidatus Cryosericum odellii]|jgi:Fur family ferric uptake transcriptional regulator|uniref:Transcriptional repressor n=1 Tax=Candidatus Cryosericum odellii TaxID=2290917 RepID=A0A398CXZ6_9BACT|nr:Fur family transcriptional regulator [Candidatus Cryosericum odellii]RIE07120.1 transcriptional repressor [Candidatus Cryosericum odellii]RIE08198.1 transcriptional repressor [Candidatus Cryosericum odellii]